MKTYLKAVVLISIAIIFSSSNLSAQPKYGNDSVRCIRNLSLYKEFEKQNNYTDALPPWRRVFVDCPRSHKNIYIDGAKMYNYLIAKEKDPEKRDKLVDTLMMIYDQRIQYFDEKGNVLGRKGVDYLKYRRRNGVDAIKTGYDILTESIKLRNEKSSGAILSTHFNAGTQLFGAGAISNEEVIQNYTTTINIIEANLKKKPDDKRMNSCKDGVENMFEKSGAATCEAIISIFTPRYEANPEDIDLIKKIIGFLSKTGCEDSDLFFNTSESLYSLEPSADAAYNLAKMALSKKDFDKVSKYYLEAIGLETDNVVKSRYYVELGDITFREFKDLQLARNYAFNAINANESNGHAYILVGHIYRTIESCGENDIEEKALYWASVDMYQKAKAVDPELSEEVDEYISVVTPHFPDDEILFFYNLEQGQSYVIDYCWINVTTVVRKK